MTAIVGSGRFGSSSFGMISSGRSAACPRVLIFDLIGSGASGGRSSMKKVANPSVIVSVVAGFSGLEEGLGSTHSGVRSNSRDTNMPDKNSFNGFPRFRA